MTPLESAIIQIIAQYGLPTFLQIYGIISKQTITEEDIQALRLIKTPESYLNIKS